MNNKEYIARLSEELGTSAQEAQKFVNDFIEEMTHMTDADLTINGFGSFEVKKYNERIIINPASGKKMLVPPKLSITFKISNTFKNILK